MTDRQFEAIYTAAIDDNDREAFASDWALADIWGEDDVAEGDELVARAELVGRIWGLAHLTIREIRDYLGLSQREFSRRFCVPYSTVLNWEARGCAPAYVVLLLARAAGMTEGVL